MKTNYIYSILLVFFCLIPGLANAQTVIAQWNFNGDSDSSIPGGPSSPSPSVGSGTASLIGGTTATYKSGSNSDPVTTSPPNYAWQTSSYAVQGTENKQRGVQFNVSTTGYQGITVKFEQRLSNTANNTYVLQYTADRTALTPAWVDQQLFTFTPYATGTGDTWYSRTVNLSSVTAINNNPNVAFRIVSSFDPTAGTYLSATNDGSTTYLTSGNVRFDMVTFTADQVLGINEFVGNNKSFFFYPNPTNGDIIHFNNVVDVSISDLLGKEVMKANDVFELNLSSLIPGMYFIRNEDGYTTKLFKN